MKDSFRRLRLGHLLVVVLIQLFPNNADAASTSGAVVVNARIERFVNRVALPQTQWSSVDSIRVQGVLFYFSRFSARSDLDEILNAVTFNGSPLERMLFTRGQVLLSGWHAKHHWLLQLNQIGNKVEGILSVLPFEQRIADLGEYTQESRMMREWANAYSGLLQNTLKELQ